MYRYLGGTANHSSGSLLLQHLCANVHNSIGDESVWVVEILHMLEMVLARMNFPSS